MKFEDIQSGKKLFHVKAIGHTKKETGRKERQTSTIRVLELDKAGRRVCASINGAPAQWYNGTVFTHWFQTISEAENAI